VSLLLDDYYPAAGTAACLAYTAVQARHAAVPAAG